MKNIIFATIGMILVIAILELLSYAWIKRYSDTGFYGKRPVTDSYHPIVGWQHPPNHKIGNIWTDAKGRSETNTTGDKTIIITGGSSLFGVGQTDNSLTMPSRLGHMLGMRVINLSCKACRTYQDMLIARRYFLNEKADVWISVSGVIDSMYANTEPDLPLMPSDVWAKAKFIRRAEEQLPIVRNVDGYFRRYSYSIDLFSRLVRKFIRDPMPVYVPQRKYGLIPEQARRTIDHYYMMQALAKRNGAEFWLFLHPIRNWDEKFPRMYYDELMKQGKDIIDDDLRDFLPKERFVDIVHWDNEGAEMLAERIAKEIK